MHSAYEASVDSLPLFAVPMSADTVISLGDISVDSATRTLMRGGRRHYVEPKVFNLIVHLMTHQDRVVTRRELLDVVWGTRVCVTEGVVTRAVMKARRLIGSHSGDALTIKTIHRIGYRLIHKADEEANAFVAALDPTVEVHAVAHAARTRIAVLPCEDRTGNPALSWLGIGLMASTIEAIAATGMEVASTRDTISALGATFGTAEAEATVEQVRAELGATDVVQACITRDAWSRLTVRYQGSGPSLSLLRGEVVSDDIGNLCRLLVLEIKQFVSGAILSRTHREMAVDRDSPRGAFATAVLADDRWEAARKLLQVALDIFSSPVAMVDSANRPHQPARDEHANGPDGRWREEASNANRVPLSGERRAAN